MRNNVVIFEDYKAIHQAQKEWDEYVTHMENIRDTWSRVRPPSKGYRPVTLHDLAGSYE